MTPPGADSVSQLEPAVLDGPVAPGRPDGPAEQVELRIGGMTCASCAARVERKLNRLDGVAATVNYATEKATVVFHTQVSPADLVAAVEKAGYTAELPAPPPGSGAPEAEDGGAPEVGPDREPRRRLLVSAALAIPVVVLSMIPPLQFVDWQWLSLAL